MSKDKTASRPTVIFDLGGVLLSVDFMRACARLEAAGGAPAADLYEDITKGADKAAFDAGRLDPQEFAARFCAAMGLRLAQRAGAFVFC